jgi:hypothetical protein
MRPGSGASDNTKEHVAATLRNLSDAACDEPGRRRIVDAGAVEALNALLRPRSGDGVLVESGRSTR